MSQHSIRTLTRVLTSSSYTRFTRRYSQSSNTTSSSCPIQQLNSHLHDLHKSLSPSLLTLDTSFVDRPRRRGIAVAVDQSLIVTSANTIAHVSAYFEPRPVEKPDVFERGCILHKSFIGATSALTSSNKLLKTAPLAVNFGRDIAVLEVVGPEGNLVVPNCVAVAGVAPSEEDIMVAVDYRSDRGSEGVLGSVRGVGRRRDVRIRAPWPLEDGSAWIEHDWFMCGGKGGGGLIGIGEKVVAGAVARISGSPWFDLNGEVVGIASWEVRDDRFPVGFAVPPVCIKAVLDYAKGKGPEDPVVMDGWIDDHVIHGM